jgi:hypothetical protein
MAKKPAIVRARTVNEAAKQKTEDQKCVNCGKKKCDAVLPEDPTTRKVALTTYAEATSTSDKAEFEAVASTIHNRVGRGWGSDIDQVLNKTYYDRRAGKRKYELNGYQNPRYRQGESGNVEPGDCEALKKSIAAAEEIKKNGVPNDYKDFTYFADAKAVKDKSQGTIIGGSIFGPKEFH